jgi:hypothetical protein
LIISEEPPDFWVERRERLNLGDNICVLAQPFLTRPTRTDWEAFLREIGKTIHANLLSLIVLDTITNLWPVDQENDNSAVTTALMPLRQLTATGAAVVIVHHFGAERQGARGATAFRAFPDSLTDLCLFVADEVSDRRRIMKSKGRLALTPLSITIRLNDDGTDYEVLAGLEADPPQGIFQTVSSLIPVGPPGWSARDFAERWPTQPAPNAQEISRVLKHHWEQARWTREGAGTKADPYTFWAMSSTPPNPLPPVASYTTDE